MTNCLCVDGTWEALNSEIMVVEEAAINETIPRILVNLEPVGKRTAVYEGFDFEHRDNYRDAFLPGKCDETIERIARELGWAERLEALKMTSDARTHDGWQLVTRNQPGFAKRPEGSSSSSVLERFMKR